MPNIIIDIIIVLLSLLVLFLAFTAFTHLFIPVPYVPTPMNIVREMVTQANLKPGQVVYDLGAGDGRLLIEAKKRQPEIAARGYEFILLVWILGKINIAFRHLDITWKLGNLMKADVRDADILFLYLIPSLMQKLEKKFETELKPGTLIISHSFTFPDRIPIMQKKVRSYMGETTVRVYEW